MRRERGRERGRGRRGSRGGKGRGGGGKEKGREEKPEANPQVLGASWETTQRPVRKKEGKRKEEKVRKLNKVFFVHIFFNYCNEK